ncbi:hypothetical protein K5D56_26205 [Pseudomonas cichorii]|nr:hypothetical protein [Pseudomonas cichorii]MBX8557014.1 hypothetical protein [Pseudomonas cichorii]MBX8592871.1 hypothetical protein [Pseudomonas cichorii]
MKYPTYSEFTVSLARTYDRADILCKSGAWYFHCLKEDDPETFGRFENLDEPAWVNNHLESLAQSLPGMRRALSDLIVQETKPFCSVEIDNDGYVVVPDEMKALLPEFLSSVYLGKLNGPVERSVMAERVLEISEGRKAIVWDDDVFFFSYDMPSNFIEIWWRRMYGGPGRDDTLYPLYLEPNKLYGWDCIGIER